MKRNHKMRLAGAAILVALAAACAPRAAPPPEIPPPAPAPAPAPRPAPPPAPAPLDWQQAPLSPGDWSWRREGGASVATFGTVGAPQFVVRCEPSRQVSLARVGGSGTVLTVRTTGGDRAVAASARPGPPAALVATLAASDAVLDLMVFSRGRFAVQAAGAPLLVLPAWPEPARAIEDCRA